MVKERMSLMEVVGALEKQQLVLPLFQRPFIWSEEQICDLFDSLWQGYPIGHILLLEQAPPDLELRLQCSPFQSEAGSQYLEESLQQRRKKARIFEELKEASHLVLDGQQRLFAFYIGISGAYLRLGSPGSYNSAKLYFDLYPLVKLFFENDGDMENLRAEHHQFRFYSEAQLVSYHVEFQGDLGESLQLSSLPLLPLALVQSWGRDRRTAKSGIRHFLKLLAGLPKSLIDEFEDMLDNLHHHLWVSEPIHNTTVFPRNSYDLLEIFSRLNQGSSFQASDLHYAVRIVFSETLGEGASGRQGHNYSQHLSSSSPSVSRGHYTAKELAELSIQDWSPEIFHELNPDNSHLVTESLDGEELEENYERLLLAADELMMSVDFLYHCYLFCEAENPEEIAQNIRNREGALALRNNGKHLLHFAKSLDILRDAVDSCNFIVRHWFANNLHNDYVLLPVLYYFYKQTAEYLDPLNDLQDIDLSRIVRWIALNEVAPSVFRGGLQQLAKLWPVLHHSMHRNAESKHFPLQCLQQDLQRAFGADSPLHGNAKKEQRSLTLSDEDITKLLENTKIKHRACIPLVALLYSHPQRISLMQRYEERQIDFIQPQKLLSKRMLKTYDLTDEQVGLFFAQRDSILNLQWLPKRLQTEKGDIPFRQWLSNSQQLQLLGEQNQFPKKELIINFLRFHHIKTEDGIYTIHAFERFLTERKHLLYRALKQYGQDFSDWDMQAKLTQIHYAAF